MHVPTLTKNFPGMKKSILYVSLILAFSPGYGQKFTLTRTVTGPTPSPLLACPPFSPSGTNTGSTPTGTLRSSLQADLTGYTGPPITTCCRMFTTTASAWVRP